MTYIPRSSLGQKGSSSTIPRVVKKKRTFRVFNFIGSLILVLAIVASGGVFFFENISEGQLERAKLDLAAAADRAGDRDAKLAEIRHYDEQLKTAGRLLDNHLAPSLLFDALEINTKQTIQFKEFSYEYDPGFDALLTLGGGTDAFGSVVLQKTQLTSVDSPFDTHIVSNISKFAGEVQDGEAPTAPLYEEDEVTFNVSGLLKTNRLVYTGEIPVAEEQEFVPESEDEDTDIVPPEETSDGDNQPTL